MSSYQSKGKSKASSKARFDYPTRWSEWEWHEERKCYRKYRLVAHDNYEFYYTDSEAEQRQEMPDPWLSISTSGNATSNSLRSNTASSNYTTGPVDTVIQDFARTDLGGTASPVHHIATRNPSTSKEKFDANYKIHAEKEFRLGKVFRVLWTEPKGNGQGKGGSSNYTGDTHSERVIRGGEYDEGRLEKVRRFVIISQTKSTCICLPINTYSGQGTNKKGVHAKDHAIIYTTEKPIPLAGEREKGMTREPIRVIPINSRHKLDRSSRLNYAKVYTVETNMKVWFIGKIHPSFDDKIVADYHLVHAPFAAPKSYLPASSEDTYAHPSSVTSGPYYPGDGGGFGAGTAGSNSYYQGSRTNTMSGLVQNNASYNQGGGAASMLAPTGSSSYAPSGDAVDDFYEADTSDSYSQHQNSTSYPLGGAAYTQKPGFDGYTQGDYSGSYDQSGGSTQYPHQKVSGGYTQNGRADPYYQSVDTGQYSSHPSTIPSSMSMPTSSSYRTISGSYDPKVMLSSVPASSYTTTSSYRARNSMSRPAEYLGSYPPESQYTILDHTSSSKRSRRSRDYRTSSKGHILSSGDTDAHVAHGTASPYSTPRKSSGRIAGAAVSDSRYQKSGNYTTLSSAVSPHNEGSASDNQVLTKGEASIYTAKPNKLAASVSKLRGIETDGEMPILPPEFAADLKANLKSALSNNSSKPITATHDISRIPSPASLVESPTYCDFAPSPKTPTGDSLKEMQDHFIALLNEDKELQISYDEALQKVDLNRFEQNFRYYLEQMSDHLRVEASSPEEKLTARLVQRFSTNAAHVVRTRLQSRVHTSETIIEETTIEQDNQTCNAEDLIPVDKVNHQVDPLEYIESFILASNSFALLKEKLRLFLHPDPFRMALLTVWPVTEPRSSKLALLYDTESDLFQFLRLQFPEGQKLGDVQTLTGGSVNAQASSCRDYLSATLETLGEAESLLLDGMEEILAITHGGSKSGTVSVQTSQVKIEFQVEMEQDQHMLMPATASNTHLPKPYSRTKTLITATASHDVHIRLMTAVTWLCAAIRYSPHPEVVLSSTTIGIIKTSSDERKIMIRLNELQKLPTEACCWHQLFPHGVIAKDFPIRDRRQGKGLEISLPDMILLSRSLSAVEFNGGLVFEGLRSLLIPVQDLTDDKALQWHYEDKRRPGKHGRMSISKIFRTAPIIQWYKVVETNKLVNKRCFLGWVETASIIMGTEEHLKTDISRSGAALAPKVRSDAMNSITLGTGGMGMVTANASRTWGKVSVPSRLTFDADKDIQETLVDDADVHIIVYDNGTKTGWGLPQANVALHLVHSILKRRGSQVFDGQQLISLQCEESSLKGSNGAISVLTKSLQFKVRNHGDGEDAEGTTLGRLIAQVWLRLEKIKDGLDDTSDEFSIVGSGPPETLRGVEFADVSEMKQRVTIKEIKISQSWSHLAHQSAVLFCKGLGQPIIPILPPLPNYLCDAWTSVPIGKNFLVLTGDAIAHYLRQQEENARLHTELEWICDKLLIQTHRQGEKCSVSHTQSLRTVLGSPLDKHIWGKMDSHRQSCFIFSNSKLKKSCQQHSVASTYYIGTGPLPKCLPVSHALDSHQGFSETSAQFSNSDTSNADAMSSGDLVTPLMHSNQGPSIISVSVSSATRPPLEGHNINRQKPVGLDEGSKIPRSVKAPKWMETSSSRQKLRKSSSSQHGPSKK